MKRADFLQTSAIMSTNPTGNPMPEHPLESLPTVLQLNGLIQSINQCIQANPSVASRKGQWDEKAVKEFTESIKPIQETFDVFLATLKCKHCTRDLLKEERERYEMLAEDMGGFLKRRREEVKILMKGVRERKAREFVEAARGCDALRESLFGKGVMVMAEEVGGKEK